jgi:hypothetical protein
MTHQRRLMEEEAAIQFDEVRHMFEGMSFFVFIAAIIGWILFIKFFRLGGMFIRAFISILTS